MRRRLLSMFKFRFNKEGAAVSSINPRAHQPRRLLRYEDSYPCPFCRQGQISCLFMMEAFSCDLCDRIFSSDLPNQTLKLETGSGPRAKQWHWWGDRWQSERQGQTTEGLSAGLQALSLTIIALPTALIGLSSYMFPPLPTQQAISFPVLWTGLTFTAHLIIVLWFWLEYYQISLWAILRIRLQRWRWV